MSLKIMTEVWAMDLPRMAEKMVLLAIADNADDDGIAWPSPMTIAAKCSVHKVTVYRAIKSLRKGGFLEISTDRKGRKVYKVCTNPEKSDSLKELRSATPELQSATEKLRSATPLYKGTVIEPPKEPSGDFSESDQGELFEESEPMVSKTSELFARLLPATITQDVDAMLALGDFERHRREMKKPMTQTAVKRLCRKIREWKPGQITASIEKAIANGWRDVYLSEETQQAGQPEPEKPDFGNW